jgi:hypothetical protein
MDIISMAQQAKPNDIGQIELRRAQFTTLSSDASKIPSSFRKFASWPGASSVTPFASSIAIVSIDPQACNLNVCDGYELLPPTTTFCTLEPAIAIKAQGPACKHA